MDEAEFFERLVDQVGNNLPSGHDCLISDVRSFAGLDGGAGFGLAFFGQFFGVERIGRNKAARQVVDQERQVRAYILVNHGRNIHDFGLELIFAD